MDDDTIAALSTPLGRGGIALIRVSGQNTLDIINNIAEKVPKKVIPKRAYHTFIVDKLKRIDECIITFYKKPNSYTGEDVAEISIHSNPFIIEEVLDLILRNNARGAFSGEFTYRAFKNGKMDLIQAESVNELINANSKYYALMKFGNLEGKLSELMKRLRENLIELGIKIETIIEFEEDQFLDDIDIICEIRESLKIIEKILLNSRFAEILDRGLNVVIAGKVNVGKSSLFNLLLMEDRSIISHIPGTTRDFIKEKIHINGLPFEITDVAGMDKKVVSSIEKEGIKRSYEKIKKSDAVIFMLDASRELNETDLNIFNSIKCKERLVVVNKIDIANNKILKQIRSNFIKEKIYEISVKKNINVDVIFSFLNGLVNNIKNRDIDFIVNYRQMNLLKRLGGFLKTLINMIKTKKSNAEIIAEEIRSAIKVIAELTGDISNDEILNGIFSKFCIGK